MSVADAILDLYQHGGSRREWVIAHEVHRLRQAESDAHRDCVESLDRLHDRIDALEAMVRELSGDPGQWRPWAASVSSDAKGEKNARTRVEAAEDTAAEED